MLISATKETIQLHVHANYTVFIDMGKKEGLGRVRGAVFPR